MYTYTIIGILIIRARLEFWDNKYGWNNWCVPLGSLDALLRHLERVIALLADPYGFVNLQSVDFRFKLAAPVDGTKRVLMKRMQGGAVVVLKDLLRTEQLSAVATVMTSFGEREFDAAAQATVDSVVFHPVVGHHPARVIRDAPAEYAALRFANVHRLVVPATNMHTCRKLGLQNVERWVVRETISFFS